VGNPSKVAAFMERISSARRILTQDVDLVLAVSGRVKEILVDFGIPDERILVQKIGSSAAENNWLRIGSRKVKTASGDGPIRFGYFGTMMARKGPHVILEALARLESTKKPFRVDLYGAGLSQAYRTRLDHLLARIPRLAETVHFMGGYTQRDMPGLLEDIDVAIIPPVWEDNGPQTVMEALGAGVPVIGARIGGIPDFVHHGVNGILFGPGKGAALASAMRRLLEETPLLDTLKSGITRPLTMREHAAALLNIYTSLARDGGKIVKRRRESSALKRKAASAIQRGDLERAEACLQEALRCVPEDLETRQRLACLLGEMGRIDESLSHLRIVSKNRPGHAQAYNDMGVLCHRLGDTQQAIQHLERAVALEKENPLFLENMTAAYLSCGRVEDALTLYQKILSADPGNLDALAALGEICAVSNRGEDARFFWRKMLDIEPDNPFALKRLEGRPEESEGLSASL
jgi:tetratricopeptide (TPR) repeat protein